MELTPLGPMSGDRVAPEFARGEPESVLLKLEDDELERITEAVSSSPLNWCMKSSLKS